MGIMATTWDMYDTYQLAAEQAAKGNFQQTSVEGSQASTFAWIYPVVDCFEKFWYTSYFVSTEQNHGFILWKKIWSVF